MRVVVSGGGTGGHIFPALALCEALKQASPDCELLYIGGISGMESEIVPKQGIAYQPVTANKLRKLVSFSTLGVAVSLFKGFTEARTYLKAFKADVVVGTGGYVAAAATLAGATSGLPTLILAPDLLPGRTNRLLSRFVQQICVVFEETVAAFPKAKTFVTGLPLRGNIVLPDTISKAEARLNFTGLAPDKFTLLIIGGSQGARALNLAVLDAAPTFLEAGVQIIHQVGTKNLADVEKLALERGLTASKGYLPLGFMDANQVPSAYRASDVILCRGGISTLSEVTANGLPAMIVPLPTAYADHQTYNAKAVEAKEAAIHFPEKGLTATSLFERVQHLQTNPELLNTMRTASLRMGRPNAAAEIADRILQMKR